MALGGQHVLGFSPDGKLFALINEQGILRIWDTETNELKQEYTPSLHLSGPCTSLTWLAAAQQTAKKQTKKARKSEVQKTGLYIALGTSNGNVSLYSYAEGQIERTLKGDGHSGKVTGITQDDSGLLYTCGEDCQIVAWSVAEEKQQDAWSIGNEKPTSIAYMPHSKTLVIGARQILVYSADSHELVQTFTGHTTEINLMTSFVADDNVEYVLTTSKMERIICLWKLGKRGKNKAAACTLLMEDIAHSLSCQLEQQTKTLKVASVTRSGVIHMYQINIDSIKSEKPVKPKVTIEIASDSATTIAPIAAVAASLQHIYGAQDILFGYGGNQFLVFEHIAPNYAEKMQVLVRTDPKKLYAKKAGKGGAAAAGTDSARKTLRPLINPDDVDYKSSTVVPIKREKPIEIPMEARLKNLHLTAGKAGEVPKAQSKVQLLIQALHSKDVALLSSVLATNDTKTIELTLQRLPIQYVGTLVNELTLLMQRKRMNVEFSINWLKILARTHSSQLMALGSDDLMSKFGPCIGIIEHRANCLKELSKFSGRLHLLVSQIKRNTEEANLNSENVLVYVDKDTSSDDEETGSKEKSDSEWDEDGEEVQGDDAESMDQDDEEAEDGSEAEDDDDDDDQDEDDDGEDDDEEEDEDDDDDDEDVDMEK